LDAISYHKEDLRGARPVKMTDLLNHFLGVRGQKTDKSGELLSGKKEIFPNILRQDFGLK